MKEQNSKTDLHVAPSPFPLSWVDRLFAWIDDLWGPTWLFYLVLFLLMTLVGHGTLWMEGSLPAWELLPSRIAEQPLLLYFPALMQYLNSTARRSLHNFQPILHAGAVEISRLEYELTKLPRSFGIVVGVAGLVIGAQSVIAQPKNFGITSTSSVPTLIYTYLSAIASVIFFITFILHTIRQLRVVSRIHGMTGNINLFERLPVYAFSALTVRTGFGILALVYYYIYIFFVIQLFGPYKGSIVDFSFAGIGLFVAVGSFVLPLYGMHRRLVDEKTRLVAEASRRFESTLNRLHQQLDSGNLDEMDQLNKALASLTIEREALAKISTWPWKPETMRGFLTSIVLPVLLWLITTILGEWLVR